MPSTISLLEIAAGLAGGSVAAWILPAHRRAGALLCGILACTTWLVIMPTIGWRATLLVPAFGGGALLLPVRSNAY